MRWILLSFDHVQLRAARADASTDQLKTRLSELDAQIADTTEACEALRMKVVANDKHITQLVQSINLR